MFRLVHFHDGVRTDGHGERIEPDYRTVRFERQCDEGGNDRDEREERCVALRTSRFFDRPSEVQKQECVAQEMEEPVVYQRSDEETRDKIGKRVRKRYDPRAVRGEFGLGDCENGRYRSGEKERVIEAFPVHGFSG